MIFHMKYFIYKILAMHFKFFLNLLSKYHMKKYIHTEMNINQEKNHVNLSKKYLKISI